MDKMIKPVPHDFADYLLVLTEKKVTGTWKRETNSEKSQNLPADSPHKTLKAVCLDRFKQFNAL